MTLQETKEWMEDLRNILVDANICRENSSRILNSVYQNEESVKNSGFFNQYLFQMKFIMAIQFCKILQDNDNQKRNLNKLIRRLESEPWNEDLRLAVEANYCLERPGRNAVIEETLRIKDEIVLRKDLIGSIIKVRNQTYAHFDPTRDKLGPTVKKYEEAVIFASELYNKLSFVMFGTSTAFNCVDDWKIDPILRSLSKELTDWLEERKNKYGTK